MTQTKDMVELAQRAVACKGWQWMEGMRLRSIRRYLRIVGCNSDGTFRLSWDDPDCPVEGDSYAAEDLAKAIPNLSDPATLGCLRYLAAKAHGAFEVVIQTDIQPRMEGTHGWWRAIDSRSRKIQGAFGTFVCPNDGTDIRAHALVAALEAAP